jgi:hypothetical protein
VLFSLAVFLLVCKPRKESAQDQLRSHKIGVTVLISITEAVHCSQISIIRYKHE